MLFIWSVHWRVKFKLKFNMHTPYSLACFKRRSTTVLNGPVAKQNSKGEKCSFRSNCLRSSRSELKQATTEYRAIFSGLKQKWLGGSLVTTSV